MLDDQRPSITTGSTNVKTAGYSDEGGWHRAVMTAKHLYEKGFWNGIETITIHNPYDAHLKMMCGWREPLVEGADFSFPDRENVLLAEQLAQALADYDVADDEEVDYITDTEAYEKLCSMYETAVQHNANLAASLRIADERNRLYRKLLSQLADLIAPENDGDKVIAQIRAALAQ